MERAPCDLLALRLRVLRNRCDPRRDCGSEIPPRLETPVREDAPRELVVGRAVLTRCDIASVAILGLRLRAVAGRVRYRPLDPFHRSPNLGEAILRGAERLDESGEITNHGRRVLRLVNEPVDPLDLLLRRAALDERGEQRRRELRASGVRCDDGCESLNLLVLVHVDLPFCGIVPLVL